MSLNLPKLHNTSGVILSLVNSRLGLLTGISLDLLPSLGEQEKLSAAIAINVNIVLLLCIFIELMLITDKDKPLF